MNELPDILSADMVSDDINVFWDATNRPDFNKEVSVLILSADFQDDSPEAAQLGKMLQACNLSSEHYHILKLKKDQRAAWFSIREAVKPKIVLLLGIEPASLGISALFRLNAPNRFDDVLMIPAIALADLEQQPEHKKDLWLQGLKPVFVDRTYGDLI